MVAVNPSTLNRGVVQRRGKQELVRAEWIWHSNLTVKSGLLFPLSYARLCCAQLAWAGFEPARTRFKGQASYRLLNHAIEPLEACSNRRPSRYEGEALPSELSRLGRRAESRSLNGCCGYNVAARPKEYLGLGWKTGYDPAPPAWNAVGRSSRALASDAGRVWFNTSCAPTTRGRC